MVTIQRFLLGGALALLLVIVKRAALVAYFIVAEAFRSTIGAAQGAGFAALACGEADHKCQGGKEK